MKPSNGDLAKLLCLVMYGAMSGIPKERGMQNLMKQMHSRTLFPVSSQRCVLFYENANVLILIDDISEHGTFYMDFYFITFQGKPNPAMRVHVPDDCTSYKVFCVYAFISLICHSTITKSLLQL